jgi:hypothetical protein
MANKKGKIGAYDVGYCKTPKHTRWPKGVSGHPAGKKVKPESFADTFNKIAGEEIIVSKNGTPVVMTNVEAMLYMAFHKAQSGDPQFFKALLKELPDLQEAFEVPAFEVSEADIQVLETEADFRGLIEAAKAKLQPTDTLNTEDPGGQDDADCAF